MGQIKKIEKKLPKFHQIKYAILKRIEAIRQMMKDVKELESAGYGGDNVKEIIKLRFEIREQIRQANDECMEMDSLYKKEVRKRKSKFSSEELGEQAALVKRMNREIETVSEAQGYTRSPDTAVVLNTKAMTYDIDSSNNVTPSWGGVGGGLALTDHQQQQIYQLEERDANVDLQLEGIGEGIHALLEMTQQQGEHVNHQNKMLDKVHKRNDKHQRRLNKIHGKKWLWNLKAY